MSTAKKVARKEASAVTRKKRGNMKPAEIKPLVMAARKAYDAQDAIGLTDGLSFDDWRRREVMACVGKPGLTACDHDDYRPVLAHFQALAGDDAAAFATSLSTGKPTDHAAQGDTHERRRQLAHLIVGLLDFHLYLSSTPAEQIVKDSIAVYEQEQAQMFPAGQEEERIPWEMSLGPAAVRGLLSRKAAINSRDAGPITAGYIVWLVRQKTKRPDLKLGQNLQDGLADRCTVNQLEQIRWTLQNRINAIEGIGETRHRNKSQRSPKSTAARREKGSDRRW